LIGFDKIFVTLEVLDLHTTNTSSVDATNAKHLRCRLPSPFTLGGVPTPFTQATCAGDLQQPYCQHSQTLNIQQPHCQHSAPTDSQDSAAILPAFSTNRLSTFSSHNVSIQHQQTLNIQQRAPLTLCTRAREHLLWSTMLTVATRKASCATQLMVSRVELRLGGAQPLESCSAPSLVAATLQDGQTWSVVAIKLPQCFHCFLPKPGPSTPSRCCRSTSHADRLRLLDLAWIALRFASLQQWKSVPQFASNRLCSPFSRAPIVLRLI
jgi:hypothetical protein